MKRVWIGFIGAVMIGSPAVTWAGEGSYGDFNRDGDVDLYDYYALQICLGFSGPDFLVPATCGAFDLESDGDVDLKDVGVFVERYSGSSSALHVEAGGLAPIPATFGSYYSGEPGKTGQNALNGIAAQAGFTQDDLWYQWTVDAQPEFSGQVVLSNASRAATAFTILQPTLPGTYIFQLSVTNLNTGEMASDFVSLVVSGCSADVECDDAFPCTTDQCLDGGCVNELVNCDDGIACTADVCVLESGACAHSDACPPSQICDAQSGECRDIVCEFDSQCDDGQFCNGVERCVLFACILGNLPCAVDEVCDEINNECEPLDGCFDFSLSADTLSGTIGDDRFCAPLFFNECTGTLVATMQPNDTVDGLDGLDVLSMELLGTSTQVLPVISNIESVNISYFGEPVSGAALTVGAGNMRGVDSINTLYSTGDIVVQNLQVIPRVGFVGTNDPNIDVQLSFGATSVTSGNADTLTALIDGMAGNLSVVLLSGAGNNGIETVNVVSEGEGENFLNGFVHSATSLSNAIITGDAPLMLKTLPNSVTTIDGSGMHADLLLGGGGSTGTYSPINSANLVSVKGGTGNDVLILTNSMNSSDFATNPCDMGDGYDAIQLTLTGNLGFPLRFRNVEELRLNATATATVDLGDLDGLEMITVDGGGTTQSLTLSNVLAGASGFPVLHFRGDGSSGTSLTFDTVTFSPASASGTSDNLTITCSHRGATNQTLSISPNGPLVINGIESILFDCPDGPCSLSGGVSASSLRSLVMRGANSVLMRGAISASENNLASIDCGGLNGHFLATIDHLANNAEVTLTSGNDNLTVGTSVIGSNKIFRLGGGNDAFTDISTTPAADTILGGSGQDIIQPGLGADTITTGSEPDVIIFNQRSTGNTKSITDFTSGGMGDVLRFDISILGFKYNGFKDFGGISLLSSVTDIFLLTGSGFESDARAETIIAADNNADGALVFIYFNLTDNTTHILYDSTAETDLTPAVLVARLINITTQEAHDSLTLGNIDVQP